MLRWLIVFVAAALGIAAFAQEEEREEQRFALLIGNEAYGTPGLSVLENPIEDVGRIRDALLIANFPRENIVELIDAGEAETLRAIRKFEADLKASKEAGYDPVGFFYYSGHGAALDKPGGGRENYLIPTGEDIQWAEDLEADGVPLGDQIDRLASVGAKAVFVVVDACRNTLSCESCKGGVGTKGLSPTEAPGGLLIAFAAADGHYADDDSIFSSSLADEISRPGQSADAAFLNAARATSQAKSDLNRVPVIQPRLTYDVTFTPEKQMVDLVIVIDGHGRNWPIIDSFCDEIGTLELTLSDWGVIEDNSIQTSYVIAGRSGTNRFLAVDPFLSFDGSGQSLSNVCREANLREVEDDGSDVLGAVIDVLDNKNWRDDSRRYILLITGGYAQAGTELRSNVGVNVGYVRQRIRNSDTSLVALYILDDRLVGERADAFRKQLQALSDWHAFDGSAFLEISSRTEGTTLEHAIQFYAHALVEDLTQPDGL